MTNAELIQKLEEFPKDASVLLSIGLSESWDVAVDFVDGEIVIEG